jgi:serine/threonine protein kinase
MLIPGSQEAKNNFGQNESGHRKSWQFWPERIRPAKIMASKAVQQLLEQGQRSGLFSAAAAQDMLAHLTAEEALTANQLATKLMERNLLTAYQAKQLLAGHGDECLIAGRYRILDKLGEGGMGAVYKAHDTQLDRDVAVKVLPSQSLHDADAIARFQREARALAKLSHPNIIQAHDSGEDKGRHFLVMEYVEGVNLAALLRTQGAIPPTLAADLICQTALGLQHAHEKGLIHRDLKPGNLLAAGLSGPAPESEPVRHTPAPQSERYRAMTVDYPGAPAKGPWKPSRALVKILDLGLARFLQDQLGDAHLTHEGAGLGTPDYMAPEQFRDALHADVRTDIYGLGCTLYHLIAGTVPFPGSSFSEKARAHAKKEPIPLGERCLEMPGGLEYVVSRMMAKHPGERFQTAGEVADALSPYVASGSHSMIRLRQTGKWPPGALTLTMSRQKRRRRLLVGSGLLTAAAVCLSLVVFLWPGLFGLGPAPEPLPGPSPAPKLRDKPIDEKPQPDKVIAKKPEPAKPKVVTIKNGLTVAKDGTGQYKTIGEALAKVDRPGMTIRILDDAVYTEALQIRNRSKHEGLTLESRRGATLACPEKAQVGVLIMNVPRVAVRGLVLRGGQTICVLVGGHSPGVVLEGLDCSANSAVRTTGLVLRLGLQGEDAPVLVRNCRISGVGNGIEVLGMDVKSAALPCRRLLIHDNRIEECDIGIWAAGQINDALIVGNRFVDCSTLSMRLDNLMAGSSGVLLANNSIKARSHCLQITGSARGVKQVEIRNNVLIAEAGLDMVRESSPSDKPGGWRIDHNMRQVRAPLPDSPEAKTWIPGTKDTVVDKLPLLTLDSKHEDFFRPIKDKALAKGGAGGDLPTYVGAVPPAGVGPWNWQWTWDAVVEKRLTVSKDPKTGGRFRTIAAALRVVKPKMTIRVLDAEKYPEPLVIDDAKSHEGLVLEAPQHATLVLGEDSQQALLLQGVANVRVRGFRFKDASSNRPNARFVSVGQGCPGLILEQLHCRAAKNVGGIIVLNTALEADADPMIIRNCDIDAFDGVYLSGFANAPVSRVLIVDNRIKAEKRGIVLDLATHDVLVGGNVVFDCQQAGIQIENPLPATQRILVANNSLISNSSAVRIWCRGEEGKLEKSQVEFRGNISLKSSFGDLVYQHQVPGAQVGDVKDSRMLLDIWRFGQNFRDRAGAKTKGTMPLGKDLELDLDWLISRTATDPDFLRPKLGTPLAKGGAGGDLPSYVGAVPPEGVQAWDWQKTWKARMEKK